MAARKRRAAVETPKHIEARNETAGGTAEPAVLPGELEHRPRWQGPVKSFWTFIFLGLIGLLLGIVFGGLIRA
jgi:hypothetical protein